VISKSMNRKDRSHPPKIDVMNAGVVVRLNCVGVVARESTAPPISSHQLDHAKERDSDSQDARHVIKEKAKQKVDTRKGMQQTTKGTEKARKDIEKAGEEDERKDTALGRKRVKKEDEQRSSKDKKKKRKDLLLAD
jgi:hypothetical protein